MEGEVPDGDVVLPFGKARIEREGADITIVSWSSQLHTASKAASGLESQGISAEVIDLRTLWPWDRDAVFASVEKTGRLLITHESVSVGGFGAEIAATVSEHLFKALKAPVRRCAAPRIPISYAPPLEDVVRVSESQIIATVTEMMAI